MNKLTSCVIVTNQYTSMATIRFANPEKDKIISGNKPHIYGYVEKYIKAVLND